MFITNLNYSITVYWQFNILWAHDYPFNTCLRALKEYKVNWKLIQI